VTRRQPSGAPVSLSAVGTLYDNATAERVFNPLKAAEVYLKDSQPVAEAEAHGGQCMAAVYRGQRLHASLGSVPPAEFAAAGAQLTRG
jgi:transposase InsO family protein